MGTKDLESGPIYSAPGRISLLSARCSNTWAHQPVTRERTNIGVNIGVGICLIDTEVPSGNVNLAQIDIEMVAVQLMSVEPVDLGR